MLSSRIRDTLPQAAVALAVVASVVVLLTRIAHAAQAVAPIATAAPFDWNFWIGVLLAAATAGSYVLHALAARRHSATLEKWAAAIDEGRVVVKGVAPAPLAVAKAPGTGTAAMLVVVLLGITGAGLALAPGCTPAERATAATTAKVSLVNCTAQTVGATPALDLATLVAVVNLTAAERAKCMTATGISWPCVETDAIAKGVTLGGCMFVDMVAAAAKAIQPSASGLAANPAPPPGRVELEDYRGKVGGATWHTSAGDQ
jgi:hypothetical protein